MFRFITAILVFAILGLHGQAEALFAPASSFTSTPCVTIDQSNEGTVFPAGIDLDDAYFTGACGGSNHTIYIKRRTGETESVYTLTGTGSPKRGLRVLTDVSIECEDGVIIRGNGFGIAVSADETVGGVSDGDLDFSQIINCHIDNFREGARINGVTFFDILYSIFSRTRTGAFLRNATTTTFDFNIFHRGRVGILNNRTGDDTWNFDGTFINQRQAGVRNFKDRNGIIANSFFGLIAKARCDGTGHLPIEASSAFPLLTHRSPDSYQTRSNRNNLREFDSGRTLSNIESNDCGGSPLELVVSDAAAAPNMLEPYDSDNPDPGDYGFILSNVRGVQLANDSCDYYIAGNEFNYNRDGLRLQNRVHNLRVDQNSFTDNRNSLMILNNRLNTYNNRVSQCLNDPTKVFCPCYLEDTSCTPPGCTSNFDGNTDRAADVTDNDFTQSNQRNLVRIDRTWSANFGFNTDPGFSLPTFPNLIAAGGALDPNTIESTHDHGTGVGICITRNSELLNFENNEFTRGIIGIAILGSDVPLGDVTVENIWNDTADIAYYAPGMTNNAQCRNLTPSFCGNGWVGQGETCDDGNLNNGDDCDAACIISPAPDDPPKGDIDPICGFTGNGVKVFVCHKEKHTICIAEDAVQAHLDHGDTLGICPDDDHDHDDDDEDDHDHDDDDDDDHDHDDDD